MRPMLINTAVSAAAMGFLLLSAVDVMPGAQAQPTASPMAQAPAASVSTADFVKKAAISDMYEVEAGRIAQSRSQNADVKDFAGKMIEAHTSTTTALKGILSSTNQTALAPRSMDRAHRELIAQLKKAAADRFDATYAQQQVQGHEDAVALFIGYSQSGQDQQIQKFASDTLPTIQQHLDMARKLSAGK